MVGSATFIPEPEPISLPAPIWLLQGLLFITFVLHIVPMNMTLGGLVMLAHGEMTQRMSEPLRRWIVSYLPVTTAFTITTGVAPLLFLQVLYGQLFFPAAIMIAWAWFAVIIALLLGYYGIYAYALASDKLGRWRSWVIIGSTLLFLYIAFAFNNAITLMSTPFRWWDIWQERDPSVHFNMNWWEPTLFPRFAHFLLGALAVTGIIVALYGSMAMKRLQGEGRQMLNLGVSWFVGATLVNYFVGPLFLFTHEEQIWRTFVGGNLLATILLWGSVALSLLAITFALMSKRSERPMPLMLAATVSIALTVIGMAGVRSIVRSLMIVRHAREFDLSQVTVEPQWGIIVLFVIIFLAGIGVVVWMLMQMKKAKVEAL
ncbi:MAG: hypothetical protein NZ805_14715 [Armatimonadetes bacterium]|nr:hypothetical protein [Armatimonadota bacterium]MDW8029518.1 hypothetical protein [Armatimonadota bacterium]